MTKPKKIKKANSLKVVTTLSDVQVKSINSWVSPYDSNSKVNWDKTTPWKVTSEGDRGFIILRYVRFFDKTSVKERFDRSRYEFHKKDKSQCEEICNVLNYRLKSKLLAKNAWKIRSEFIKVQGSELSHKFEAYMLARSANAEHAKKMRRGLFVKFILMVLSLGLVACNSSTPSGVDFCLHAKENLKVGNFSFKEETIEECSVVSVSEDKEWGEQVRLFEPDSKVKMFVSTLELIVDGKPMKRVLTAEVLDKDVNVRSNKEVKQ